MIAIAQLARTVSIDFKFPEHINQGLSALTRSTKEAALLLSGSSFRSMAEQDQQQPPSQQQQQQAQHAQPLKPQTLPAGVGQFSSLLSPMNISPLTISPNYTPTTASPSVAAFPTGTQGTGQGGLNKFDAAIATHMRAQSSQGGEQGVVGVRSPPQPPIVSIPLPRE